MKLKPNYSGFQHTNTALVLLDNYFGRQFNSLNDGAIHSVNNDVYFTDTLYGYWQDFRPPPGLRNQVYRLTPATGAVTVVADQFTSPNGSHSLPSDHESHTC